MRDSIFMIAFFAVIISSCIKEEETHSSAMLINSTDYRIKLKGYNNGILVNNDYYTIQPKSQLEITQMRFVNRGKGIGGFNNAYLLQSDSIIVEYDDQYFVTHVRYDSLKGNRIKVLSPSDIRGIMNVDNWNIRSEEKRNIMYNYYEYTFTESDYEFAKD